MNAETFHKFLVDHDACSPARSWVDQHGYGLREAWERCERGDWMLWLAARLDRIDRRDLVRAACACARTALPYVPTGKNRLRGGETATEQIRKAAAAYAAAAVDADAYAAYAAAYAAYAPARAAYDARAAADASDAAYAAEIEWQRARFEQIFERLFD